MRLQPQRSSRKEADLTPLINIVFLILIFFLVAGTLRPFSHPDLELVTLDEETSPSLARGHLIMDAEGALVFDGTIIAFEDLETAVADPEQFSSDQPFILIADHRADAIETLKVIEALRALDVTDVSIMTQRGGGR
ncbi:MAG: biopolymer transporter ExbD [Pseudomonadota bacterium]